MPTDLDTSSAVTPAAVALDFSKHPCFNKDSHHTHGRIHLPVAPRCNLQCNFCNRKFDCMNESRPGVTSAVLTPEQAADYLDATLKRVPNLAVMGIAGPGDPFANAVETMATLKLVRQRHKDMILCLATNGLGVGPHISNLAALQVSHVTLTVNAVDAEIGSRIYSWIRDGYRPMRGVGAAQLLLDRQLDAIVRLKEAGIGTYILFQETYHRQTYGYTHPSGPKHDYCYHTTAMDRAMQGGIDDVGFGVLFGLYDYKFEVLAMIMHALHMEEAFGVGPHTISVPRLRPAPGVDYDSFPYLVNDAEFKKIIAILRLAVPYTGMILSTRERPEFRDELLSAGISQISAGSCTGVGGYKLSQEKISGCSACNGNTPQFHVEDHRNPDEVLRSICLSGFIPSFCTACYRRNRTGDRFMTLAKSGQIKNVCQPNAILTFKEFLEDYASPSTREAGETAILSHLDEITDPKIRLLTNRRLKLIEQGQRDMYF